MADSKQEHGSGLRLRAHLRRMVLGDWPNGHPSRNSARRSAERTARTAETGEAPTAPETEIDPESYASVQKDLDAVLPREPQPGTASPPLASWRSSPRRQRASASTETPTLEVAKPPPPREPADIEAANTFIQFKRRLGLDPDVDRYDPIPDTPPRPAAPAGDSLLSAQEAGDEPLLPDPVEAPPAPNEAEEPKTDLPPERIKRATLAESVGAQTYRPRVGEHTLSRRLQTRLRHRSRSESALPITSAPGPAPDREPAPALAAPPVVLPLQTRGAEPVPLPSLASEEDVVTRDMARRLVRVAETPRSWSTLSLAVPIAVVALVAGGVAGLVMSRSSLLFGSAETKAVAELVPPAPVPAPAPEPSATRSLDPAGDSTKLPATVTALEPAEPDEQVAALPAPEPEPPAPAPPPTGTAAAASATATTPTWATLSAAVPRPEPEPEPEPAPVAAAPVVPAEPAASTVASLEPPPEVLAKAPDPTEGTGSGSLTGGGSGSPDGGGITDDGSTATMIQAPPIAESCGEPEVALSPLAGGFTRIRMTAECRAGQSVQFRYGGAVLERQFDDAGNLLLDLDCFAGEGEPVEIALDDGIVLNRTPVPDDLERVIKVAVLWSAQVDLDLHAFQHGAGVAETAHVWSGAPGAREAADAAARSTTRAQGFISTISDGKGIGPHVEVYTLIEPETQRYGSIKLAVDHASRGPVPAGAYCGGGKLAEINYEVVILKHGEDLSREGNGFVGAPCNVAIPEAARFNKDVLPELILGR